MLYLLAFVLVVVCYMSAWTALLLDGFFIHADARVSESANVVELFSSLLHGQYQFDPSSESLVYSVRCRKLTWDYVTELSKFPLPSSESLASTHINGLNRIHHSKLNL